MTTKRLATLLIMCVIAPVGVLADELTKIIQEDLTTLGYDPGSTDGEATTQTVVAISKFQAENDMEVTGEPSPQLAGVIKAKLRNQNDSAGHATTQAAATAGPANEPAALQAAQEACIQGKIAQAQEAQKKSVASGA